MKIAVKPSKWNGFSLVELLVVIAVIAILIALIFPVFAKVMESNRKATMISNYRVIQDALGRYYLDHDRTYPAVLFGTKIGAGDNMGTLRFEYKGAVPPPGLYPTYVNDWHDFTDPDNQTTDQSATVPVDVNSLDTSGNLGPNPANPETFFTMDAMDISPEVLNPTTLSKTTWVARYQLAWTTNVGPTGPFPGGLSSEIYNRQLMFPTSDGDTYVTCTTYHVTNGKVLVLYKSGSAKTIDVTQFLGPGADVNDVSAAGAPALSPARFWTRSPDGP